jgi:hypothetical protein
MVGEAIVSNGPGSLFADEVIEVTRAGDLFVRRARRLCGNHPSAIAVGTTEEGTATVTRSENWARRRGSDASACCASEVRASPVWPKRAVRQRLPS